MYIYPIGSMYAIYGNIYHQYTPNVSIYTSTMDPMGIYIYINGLRNYQVVNPPVREPLLTPWHLERSAGTRQSCQPCRALPRPTSWHRGCSGNFFMGKSSEKPMEKPGVEWDLLGFLDLNLGLFMVFYWSLIRFRFF